MHGSSYSVVDSRASYVIAVSRPLLFPPRCAFISPSCMNTSFLHTFFFAITDGHRRPSSDHNAHLLAVALNEWWKAQWIRSVKQTIAKAVLQMPASALRNHNSRPPKFMFRPLGQITRSYFSCSNSCSCSF